MKILSSKYLVFISGTPILKATGNSLASPDVLQLQWIIFLWILQPDFSHGCFLSLSFSPPPPALCVCTLDGGNAEPPRIANIVIYLAVSVCLCVVLLGNFQSLAEPRTNNRWHAPAPWEEVALPLDQLGGLGGHAPWGVSNLQVDRGKESYALGWLCRAVFSSFYHLWTWSCAEFCQMAWVVTEQSP